MHMHTRTGEKPFVCSIRFKWSTMVHGCMAVWIHGKMDSWQFGFMAQWIHGSLDSWQNGFMAVWIHGTMDAMAAVAPEQFCRGAGGGKNFECPFEQNQNQSTYNKRAKSEK